MFSRVGFIKHSGSTDEIMDRLKSHKDKYDAMEGLQSVIYVKVSDAEFVGIPIWESKEAFENAQGQVQELMSMFKDEMNGPPEFKEGEVSWIYTPEGK